MEIWKKRKLIRIIWLNRGNKEWEHANLKSLTWKGTLKTGDFFFTILKIYYKTDAKYFSKLY